MKTLLILIASFIAALSLSLAGGNTSVVDLDKVISIKIEDERILIVGNGKLRKRVMSDAEHGDGTAFGQPTQMLHAKVIECEFELIPYHKRDDIEGVPNPSPSDMTPEMKARSMKWWADTLAKAKEINVGDAITIGYQREKMTLRSYFVTHIVGSGSLRIRQENEDQ